MTPHAASASHRYLRLVVAACVVGAVLNVGGALALPAESQAIRSRGSGAIGVLLTTEHDHVANRYRLYGQLRDLASGARITAPPALLESYELEHLSTLSYEPAVGRRRVAEGVLDDVATVGAAFVVRGVVEVSIGADELRDYVIAVSTHRNELHAYETRKTGTVLIVDAATAGSLGLP